MIFFSVDAPDIQQQIVRLEIQNEQLTNELHAREQELLQDKKELEKVRFFFIFNPI